MAPKRNAKKESAKPKHDFSIIRGLFILCGAIALLLSLISVSHGPATHNWIGLVGQAFGQVALATIGIGGYVLAIYIGWIGWRQLFQKPIHHPIIKTIYIIAFIASLSLLLCVVEDRLPSLAEKLGSWLYPKLWLRKLHYHLGGALFYYLYHDMPMFNLLRIFNVTGITLLCLTTLLVSVFFLTKVSPTHMLQAAWQFFVHFWKWFAAPKAPPGEQAVKGGLSRYVSLKIPGSNQQNDSFGAKGPGHEMLAIQPDTQLTVRPSMSLKEKRNNKSEKPKEAPPEAPQKKNQGAEPSKDAKGYILPPPSLLTSAKKVDQSALKQDLKRQAEVLEETLLSFGIEAKVGQINCGPSITSFEVHPAIGVKVQKIKALENDIALNMEAKSIRIIAPIPGKAAVGIEVPNPHPQEVGFKDMLQSYQQGSKRFHIPILLGKTVAGEYVMNDLAKMPHCIIAGATGSGKSVCINTIVMAVLMNAKPDEIKMIMVDPKKVELTPYTNLPHMLAPVITEPQGACAALNWLVKEMEGRYEILKHLGVRNIESFNNRTINKTLEASLEKEIPARLPYIMVIIDELADLMMVASSDIETPIARIAQMARAVGIHLILATQRPSREVITGLIKANFPTRVAFKVASRINSQIILDEVGAETLLGNGDMLFLPPGSSITMRAQGAFIRDEDIAAVVKHICDQAPPNYVIASFDALAQDDIAAEAESLASGDSLYEQAKQVVLSTKNASTTYLQRKLKIGYARAASLIDELESRGVIGATDGSKARKVLVNEPVADQLPPTVTDSTAT